VGFVVAARGVALGFSIDDQAIAIRHRSWSRWFCIMSWSAPAIHLIDWDGWGIGRGAADLAY
jgi:hypothetical protein